MVHSHPSPVPFQPVRDSDFLFGLAFNREEKEWSTQRRELKGRGPAALHNGKVANGKMLIEVWYHAMPLRPLRDFELSGVDTRSAYENHSQVWQTLHGEWIGATAKFEEGTSHSCAADGANHKRLWPITKRRPKDGPISDDFEVEAKRIADKLDMFLGIPPAVGQKESKRFVSHVLGFAEENSGVVPTCRDAPLLRPDEVEAPGAKPFK